MGGKLLRPGRLLPASGPVSPMFMLQQAVFESIVEDEERLAQKKDALLQDTGAKHMFDKKALNQADIDEYETGLKSIMERKATFKEHFGVDFADSSADVGSRFACSDVDSEICICSDVDAVTGTSVIEIIKSTISLFI